MSHRRLPLVLSLLLAAAAMPAATVADFPSLPVTTVGMANTLMRGGGHDWNDASQTYLQNYTAELAVTTDGMIYCSTSWEEGHRAAGIYKDGDALADCPTFGTSSGDCVAVNDQWIIYGQKGRLAVIQRSPGTTWSAATSHHQIFDASDSAPTVMGVALAGNTVWCVDSKGDVRSWDVSTRKPDTTVRFNVPTATFLRVDKRGNLWFMVPSTWAGYQPIAATISGESDAGHPASDGQKLVNDQTFWIKATGPAALTLDLGKSTPVHQVHFSGGGMNVSPMGAIIQGAQSAEGPWTDLSKVERETGWWPGTVITLDGKPWRYIRMHNEVGMGLRGLTAFQSADTSVGGVKGFTPEGKSLGTLPGVTAPIGLAYDEKNDRLLVSNDDADQQIHAFTGLAGQPKIDTAWMNEGLFGEKGGLTGAKGVVADRRFDMPRGIGVDGAGNLMVFSVGCSGTSQSRLESYGTDGALRWRMSGLAFLDSAETDPADTKTAYSAKWRYVRDPKGREGDGWRAVATTLDRFTFPEDARLNNLAHVSGVRRIAGKPFLFVTTQYNDQIAMYRFDKEHGEIAIPCGYIVGKPTGTAWPAYQPAGYQLRLWTDTNGDGRFQAPEWQSGAQLMMDHFILDSTGGIWWFDNRDKNSICHLKPEAALDEHGAPVYKLANLVKYPAPTVFTAEGCQIRAIEISPDGKFLFVFGFTKDLPSTIGHNFPAGRLLVKLDISSGTPVETARTELPYDVEFTPGAAKDQLYATAIAGDHLFLGYEQRMDVLVLNQSDLKAVGRLHIGQQSQTPIFDGPSELIVAKEGKGYDIFTAQYTGNATTHWNWQPGAAYLEAATGLTATAAGGKLALSWTGAAEVTEWTIECRVRLADGWGPFQAAGTSKTATWTDPKPADAAGYRVRGKNAKGALSDWSRTVWLR